MIQEWLNIAVRWIHVIAAIMWIGDSFLFMWLDSHISAATKQREGDVAGELWMTHSGAFYEVVKRKSLSELPKTLYWFKWESYTTWVTGFLLLAVVYYLGGAAFLIDKAVLDLPAWQAVAISAGMLPVAFLIYDTLWRTPLAKDQRVFAAIWFGLLVALAYVLTHVFSGRAAFLQLGATMGTVMTFNVFFRIIPSQRHMIASTKAGTPVDTSYGIRAKGRSVHNHYMTLPVLFTMLSNHFPSTYSHPQAWLVFALLGVAGVSLKYVMNFRMSSNPAVAIALFASLGTVVYLTMPPGPDLAAIAKYKSAPPVSYSAVSMVLQSRCVTCHSQTPTHPMFPAPPSGVMLDTADRVKLMADRIFIRAVTTQTMPLANLTGMTPAERELIGAWYAQGADVDAKGGSLPAIVAEPVDGGPSTEPVPSKVEGLGVNGGPPPPAGSPEEQAKAHFAQICTPCHGAAGAGDGVAASALPLKPRNFTDATWQDSVTDEQLKRTILKGGMAVGKSPLMPPNPTLEDKPEVIDALVKMVRGFRKP